MVGEKCIFVWMFNDWNCLSSYITLKLNVALSMYNQNRLDLCRMRTQEMWQKWILNQLARPVTEDRLGKLLRDLLNANPCSYVLMWKRTRYEFLFFLCDFIFSNLFCLCFCFSFSLVHLPSLHVFFMNHVSCLEIYSANFSRFLLPKRWWFCICLVHVKLTNRLGRI